VSCPSYISQNETPLQTKTNKPCPSNATPQLHATLSPETEGSGISTREKWKESEEKSEQKILRKMKMKTKQKI
jgi:hypothetical protein